MDFSKLKIAIVHDWLPVIGGAELVLKEMLEVFPDADVYTLFDFLSDEEKKELGIKNLNVSYLNKLPKVQKYYRKLLPFCPMAIEDFDLYDYDVVLSSSHAVAKGVITGAHQVHVSYVHSPCRYAWDLTHVYLKQTGMDKGIKGFLAKKLLKDFRIWDYRTANGVDQFIANSGYIKKRIYKVYRRDADVIYPPANLDRFSICEEKDDFYMTASRMVPYKRIDLIVSAFKQMPELKLKVIGDGPEMEKIAEIAKGADNITLMGYQANEVMVETMRKAKAFVFAAEEDFGIVPVEAQACGTPVIAYGAGGALETVRYEAGEMKASSGVFFEQQSEAILINAVRRFEALDGAIMPKACRANAEKFSIDSFRKNIADAVEKALDAK
ncbi:MAG: glycosyltransferase [Micavibrio sp.]|nr:glycosyltransferase [Micavibrio sp.]